VCVPDVIGAPAVWIQDLKKRKKKVKMIFETQKPIDICGGLAVWQHNNNNKKSGRVVHGPTGPDVFLKQTYRFPNNSLRKQRHGFS